MEEQVKKQPKSHAFELRLLDYDNQEPGSEGAVIGLYAESDDAKTAAEEDFVESSSDMGLTMSNWKLVRFDGQPILSSEVTEAITDNLDDIVWEYTITEVPIW